MAAGQLQTTEKAVISVFSPDLARGWLSSSLRSKALLPRKQRFSGKATRTRSVATLAKPFPAVTTICAALCMCAHVELGRRWPCYYLLLEMLELVISKLKDGNSMLLIL